MSEDEVEDLPKEEFGELRDGGADAEEFINPDATEEQVLYAPRVEFIVVDYLWCLFLIW